MIIRMHFLGIRFNEILDVFVELDVNENIENIFLEQMMRDPNTINCVNLLKLYRESLEK